VGVTTFLRLSREATIKPTLPHNAQCVVRVIQSALPITATKLCSPALLPGFELPN
jgi:hypothetical protein